MLRRITVNFIVDFVSFLDLLGLIFTGIIIRYILPPGTGGRGQELHGGQGAGRVKDFWTMTRHEWGDVHFYMVVVFIILMLIHLFLHWTWIKCYIKSLFGTKKST